MNKLLTIGGALLILTVVSQSGSGEFTLYRDLVAAVLVAVLVVPWIVKQFDS